MQDTSADADTSFNVIFKPGYVRLSLPCHASDEDINYMIESVKYVAQNGWKLLPFYKFNIASGSFRFTESGYGVKACLFYLVHNLTRALFQLGGCRDKIKLVPFPWRKRSKKHSFAGCRGPLLFGMSCVCRGLGNGHNIG